MSSLKLFTTHINAMVASLLLPFEKNKLTDKCFAGHLQPKQSYPSSTNHLLRYPAPEFKACAWSVRSNVVAVAAAVCEISKYAKQCSTSEIYLSTHNLLYRNRVFFFSLVLPRKVLSMEVPYLKEEHPVLAGLTEF